MKTSWMVALGLLAALVTPVLAADRQLIDQVQQAERAALAGITGIEVIVEEMSPDAELQGLTESALRTDVELKLRQAGIRVLTRIEAQRQAVNSAGLLLAVGTRLLEKGNYAFAIQLKLDQAVLLQRDPSIIWVAPTWEVPVMFGTIGAKNLSKLRDFVRDMVDQFINAYLAANPKK